jgi:hypothetical protein
LQAVLSAPSRIRTCGLLLSIRVYQHVISEFEDSPRLSAEDAIRQAREQRLRKLG